MSIRWPVTATHHAFDYVLSRVPLATIGTRLDSPVNRKPLKGSTIKVVESIAASETDGNIVRLSHAAIQPIAAEDVATAVTRTAISRPVNRITGIAGPEQFGMDDFIRTGLATHEDHARW
jgi:hypothetical protein